MAKNVVTDNKKYVFTNKVFTYGGRTLRQIRAVRDIPFTNDPLKFIPEFKYGLLAQAGDLGGWIEHSANLSQEGNCWITDEASVYGHALVKDNAIIAGQARVFNQATVMGNALVMDVASVSGRAKVFDSARIMGCSEISEHAEISGTAIVKDCALIRDRACIGSSAIICEYAIIEQDAKVFGSSIEGHSLITGDAVLSKVKIVGDSTIGGVTNLPERIVIHDGYILSRRGLFYVDEIVPNEGRIVFYANKNGGLTISCNWFVGEEKEFLKQLKKKHRFEVVQRYLAALKLANLQVLRANMDNNDAS